jgi:hypothetical protein
MGKIVNPYIGLLCFNIIYPLIFKIKSQHVDSDIKAYLSPKKKKRKIKRCFLSFFLFFLFVVEIKFELFLFDGDVT